MTWAQVQLQDIVLPEKGALVSGPFGSSISAKYFVEEGVPVIRGNNLTKGKEKFIDSGFAYLTEAKAREFHRCIAIENDIVFTAAGSIGQVGIIPSTSQFKEYVISNKQLRARIDLSKADPLFVYYWLSSKKMISWLENMNNGGAVPLLNLGIVRKAPIPLPPLYTQKDIASTLSNYYDLIENNKRRIELLEESARQLYKEWFVRFRFPGHEHVKIIDGVPEGWGQDTVANVCSKFIDGDWIETKDQGGEDYRILQISNIGVDTFIETGNLRFISESTFDRLNCSEVRPGDLIIARMPTHIGRAWLVTDMPGKMVTAVDVTIAKNDETKVDTFYLLHHLNSEQHIARCEAGATGATRPRVARKVMGALPILIPPLPLQNEFADFALSTHKTKTNLIRQNEQLARARDILLPKLMSGEIAV